MNSYPPEIPLLRPGASQLLQELAGGRVLPSLRKEILSFHVVLAPTVCRFLIHVVVGRDQGDPGTTCKALLFAL